TISQAPVIAACPANIVKSTDAGQCTAVASFTTPTASDNCTSASVVCLPASGTAFAKGTTVVTCTATDGSGNTNACTFSVTVNESEAPVVGACPANIVKNIDAGQCTAVVTFTPPTATDNCGGASVVCLPASGATFVKGLTVVTCTATDGSGNTNA